MDNGSNPYEATNCKQSQRDQQKYRSLLIWGLAVVCFGVTWNPNPSIRYDGNLNPIEVLVSCLIFYSGIGAPLGASLCLWSIVRAYRNRMENGKWYFWMVAVVNVITMVCVFASVPIYWYYWNVWRN